MEIRDLQALCLETYCHRTVLDPLAVLLLEKRLYIYSFRWNYFNVTYEQFCCRKQKQKVYEAKQRMKNRRKSYAANSSNSTKSIEDNLQQELQQLQQNQQQNHVSEETAF